MLIKSMCKMTFSDCCFAKVTAQNQNIFILPALKIKKKEQKITFEKLELGNVWHFGLKNT